MQFLRDSLLHIECVSCQFAKDVHIKGKLNTELTTVYDFSEEYLAFQKSDSLCCWMSEKNASTMKTQVK